MTSQEYGDRSQSKRQQQERIGLRSYGRRRGRKRSQRQEDIFQTGLAKWGLNPDGDQQIGARSFANNPRALWLEIGFGGGEHLIWQARQNPDVGFIAAEPFEDGVVKLLTAIQEHGLDNIRVYAGDVRVLLQHVEGRSIARTFILFPDPWPKARHAKRRLISPDLLSELSRLMVENGELRIATDSASYASEILQTVTCHKHFEWIVARPRDWRERPDDWPATRYEAKARRQHRDPYFFSFRHLSVGKHDHR